MAEIPQGYQDVPEEDRKKAKVFFDRGNTVAATGNYEYAIEMYLQGLAIDPDAKEAHQTLRDISLRRKASGGKDLGIFEKMKLRGRAKDDREALVRAEKLMSYDPGNPEHMLSVMKVAHKAGFYDTVLWVGAVLIKANTDSKTPDFAKYIAARDIYISIQRWPQAIEACQYAANLKPNDMDLQRILRDLGATEVKGKYDGATSFRDNIRDMDAQKKLMQADMDVRDKDVMASQIRDAEAELAADPNEAGKLTKLVDALVKTEIEANENRAIQLLQEWYDRTRQFKFRMGIGRIRMTQLRRQERVERAKSQENPQDENAKRAYVEFRKRQTEEELREFQLCAENYPTDMSHRFEMAVRLFQLERAEEAIPLFQQARNDPKLRADCSTFLGRAFLHAGFMDEAIDTLKLGLDEYEIRGDRKSKELFYWYALALEQKGDFAPAIKCYSQLLQWDMNYRDVQARVKRLRASQSAPNPGTGE